MSKNPDPCESLLLDNQLCFALHSTSLLMTKVYKPLLQAIGLTYPQYLAMMVLWEEDELTVSEISSRLLTDPGSMTPLLKRLEAEGLLNRTRSREDERVVVVELTDTGRALQEKAKDVPQCILGASGMALEQLRKLQGDLIALRANLQTSL
ncbi:MarR family transcriptional regulator [Pseudomonas lactis]|uniref:MarR family transcriptional regulator n=1 Tax=Pseudomonas fluorescens TaxID=294 RepID=A0A109LEV0_PSEFL|nr:MULTISPECIES: MarR family transcriptional regulator [Pseudomonas]KWV86313.1 Organic hydroperoxide resistance transcriptional regulator [Pseudomonas fluorescens]MBA5960919.1 MarR family transcriptional regulator [Pseudomonas lactis]MBJ2213006.1 MarR family transcriptional regulator [Pseudomonas carnis]MBN1083350.1 MarR family transcriptional regulator [Pseudomonas sp. 1079]MCF5040439.1 MarR family transcriptional regulator [Pseudomonas sp. PA-7-1E]